MPLIPATIITEIRKITDDTFELFEGFPSNANEMALRWSIAVHTYASSVVPVSLPATSELGRIAFENIMKGILPNPPNGLILLPLAFTAYAVSLGLGMAPLFVGVPPPVPLVIAPIMPAGLVGAPASVQAASLGALIDVWFRTGTATPSAGGPPVIWL